MHNERKDHCVLLVPAWSIILPNEYAAKQISSAIAAQVEKQVKDKMKAVETEAASEEQLKDYLISLVSIVIQPVVTLQVCLFASLLI